MTAITHGGARHPVAAAGTGATPVVPAAAYGPCPGRRMWIYLAVCPSGHGSHLPRGGPPRPAGHLRTAPCGARYRIVVIPDPRAVDPT